MRLSVLLCLHYSKTDGTLASYLPFRRGIGLNRTESALREAPGTSPRETHCGRNAGNRELLRQHAGSEGTDTTGEGRHIDSRTAEQELEEGRVKNVGGVERKLRGGSGKFIRSSPGSSDTDKAVPSLPISRPDFATESRENSSPSQVVFPRIVVHTDRWRRCCTS